MKYSIIIPFRDRDEHLAVLLPALHKKFAGTDFEIIVSEQVDHKAFRRASVKNVGAMVSTGDILIFHDVDYVPTDDVEYYDGTSDVFLPVKRVEFTYNNLTPKPLEEIPSGYRHFRDGVDDNFFGGVLVFKREVFYAINGFNPLYVGWGFEDVDLRARVEHAGYQFTRGDGLFHALDHPDSSPGVTDPILQRNMMMAANYERYLDSGISKMPYEYAVKFPKHELCHLWIAANSFDPPPVSPIQFSTFDFSDDE